MTSTTPSGSRTSRVLFAFRGLSSRRALCSSQADPVDRGEDLPGQRIGPAPSGLGLYLVDDARTTREDQLLELRQLGEPIRHGQLTAVGEPLGGRGQCPLGHTVQARSGDGRAHARNSSQVNPKGETCTVS
jgi:hypothetical protein